MRSGAANRFLLFAFYVLRFAFCVSSSSSVPSRNSDCGVLGGGMAEVGEVASQGNVPEDVSQGEALSMKRLGVGNFCAGCGKWKEVRGVDGDEVARIEH